MSWPPPDPDRLHNTAIVSPSDPSSFSSDHDYVEAFRSRQSKDQGRLPPGSEGTLDQRQVYQTYNNHHRRPNYPMSAARKSNHGGQAWRDSEGDQLKDFGVDEEIDFYDEDDIPLAELLRRRKGRDSTGNH